MPYTRMLCQDCGATFEGWHNRVRCACCRRRGQTHRGSRRIPIPAAFAKSVPGLIERIGQPTKLGQRKPIR